MHSLATQSSEDIQGRFRAARDQIKARIEVLKVLRQEFHGSIRVGNLPASVRFRRTIRQSHFGARVEKPPRTTWKGTPLHELWLTDPDGTLIEIYARLTDADTATKPADEKPEYLVPGTAPTT